MPPICPGQAPSKSHGQLEREHVYTCAFLCARVHTCVQMRRRERRDERERIPLTLNTAAVLNEITPFSSPKEKKKVQIIPKNQ